jgi:tRNA pseudouridine synthase 10
MKFVETRGTVLALGDVCDHCLGRQISLKYKGKPCEKIGAALRAAKKDADIAKNIRKKLKPYFSKDCPLCGGIFTRLEEFHPLIIEKMNEAQDFNSFLVGSRVPSTFKSAEDSLWQKIGSEYCEPLKRELNRVMGSWIEEQTGKKVDFSHPDANFLIDFERNRVELSLGPLFIYGRYKKYERGLPQTRWPCRECSGRGCKKCGGTGKQYLETVEELIAEPVLEKTGGKASSFHGSGREDMDARMLGTGRPFVLEIAEPLTRRLDLKQLEKEINERAAGKVGVSKLRFSDKDEVRLLKALRYEKTYDALIECAEPVTKKELSRLDLYFKGRQLMQRTPTRVLHRRADKVRKRRVISVKSKTVSEKEFRSVIKTESGTYIKELITGDEKRTRPSFSIILRKQCSCKELDVIGIHTLKPLFKGEKWER